MGIYRRKKKKEEKDYMFPLFFFFPAFIPLNYITSAMVKYFGRSLTLMIIFSRHIVLFIIT